MTDDTFDPYWQWLEIPPHERPVDHYRLLGLARFESDPQRIEAAADARMNLVRSFQSGPRVAHTQKLLNELAVARLCLVNAQAKASYDAVLRGRQALSAATAQYSANPTYPSVNPLTPPFATPLAAPPYAAAPVATFALPASVGAGQLPTAIPFPVAPPHSAHVTPPPPPPPPAPPLPLPPPPAPPPVAPPRASSASPPAKEEEGFVEEPRSLLASPWFMLTVVLTLVGGAGGAWYLTRPKAPPLEADIASADDQEDESESGEVTPETRANSKATRSTIDEPFGPIEIIQEGTGEMHFSAQTAERMGDGLVLELHGDDQVIAGWSSADQNLAWSFRVVRPDVFRVELTYAATDEARGGRFAFQVDDDDAKSGEIAPTGALDKFRTDIFHIPVHRNGRHQLFLAVQDLSHSGSVVFQTLRFVPKGISDKKKP